MANKNTPKTKKKTTVTRVKRGGVSGTLTTTKSSSTGKPKKSYAQFKAEGGDVKAAKAYNESSKSTKFREDAPSKMPSKKAKVTTKAPTRKLSGKPIPSKPKSTTPPPPPSKTTSYKKKKKTVRKAVRNVVNKVKKATDKCKPKKKGGKLNCAKF